jgi:spore maturation protein CgeB
VRIVILGLSITSSWGNGHAANYRALQRELSRRGHEVLFLERDLPWYARGRDLPNPPWGEACLYGTLAELRERFSGAVRDADLVIVGSYVPDGVEVGEWACANAGGACAFYDIDTPVTLAKLARGDFEYLSPEVVPRYDAYLSFTGGPTLEYLEREYGARGVQAFHCIVDPEAYAPLRLEPRFELGYIGTYSAERQRRLEALLCATARGLPERRFALAGSRFPKGLRWPENIERIPHLAPTEHVRFYAAQRFTLNLTREDMRAAGWSPSVRLLEAAACGVPVISDRWAGLGELFAEGEEIVIADSAEDVVRALLETPESERARARVLAEHTAPQRVDQLEALVGAADVTTGAAAVAL